MRDIQPEPDQQDQAGGAAPNKDGPALVSTAIRRDPEP